MQNADSVYGEGWYHEMIIIPHPLNNNLYYLFTVGNTIYKIFDYSIIDMNGNGGLGSVTVKNFVIDSGTFYYDAMAAVKHGNGKDWWLIAKQSDLFSNGDSIFQIYMITGDTIFHFSQAIGGKSLTNNANMTFSPKGDKLLFTTYRGLIEVLDFDRCSGLFSNAKIISLEDTVNTPALDGSAFSPNEQIIYVSSVTDTSYLFQFDLTATNIWSSIDTITTFTYPSFAGGALRLAPDNKIYLSNAYNDGINFNYPYPDSVRNIYNENISVINSPDSLGAACNFTAYSFYLGGKRTYWGLPNNPDYDMGPLNGSSCDTLTGIKDLESSARNRIGIYPNPITSEELTITFNTLTEPATVSIFNTDGKEVVCLTPNPSSKERGERQSVLHIKLPKLASGMYFVMLQTGDRRMTGRFVKQ